MKISDQNINTGMLRQNILEKANEAFSGNKTMKILKKINDAINSVADSQNKASKSPKIMSLEKKLTLQRLLCNSKFQILHSK